VGLQKLTTVISSGASNLAKETKEFRDRSFRPKRHGGSTSRGLRLFVRSVSSVPLKPQHREGKAAEPKSKIPDSRFKTLAFREVCRTSNKLRSCVAETRIRRLTNCRAEVSVPSVFSLFLATEGTGKKEHSRRNNDARSSGVLVEKVKHSLVYHPERSDPSPCLLESYGRQAEGFGPAFRRVRAGRPQGEGSLQLSSLADCGDASALTQIEVPRSSGAETPPIAELRAAPAPFVILPGRLVAIKCGESVRNQWGKNLSAVDVRY
jgi:hypothetical protein